MAGELCELVSVGCEVVVGVGGVEELEELLCLCDVCGWWWCEPWEVLWVGFAPCGCLEGEWCEVGCEDFGLSVGEHSVLGGGGP